MALTVMSYDALLSGSIFHQVLRRVLSRLSFRHFQDALIVALRYKWQVRLLIIPRALKVYLLLIPSPGLSQILDHICALVEIYELTWRLSEGHGLLLRNLHLRKSLLNVCLMVVLREATGRRHRVVLLELLIDLPSVCECGTGP